MTNINFILENDSKFSFEWENKSLPVVNDHIIFDTSIKKTDVDNKEVIKLLNSSVFIIQSRMWVSDDEITIFIKKSGDIK